MSPKHDVDNLPLSSIPHPYPSLSTDNNPRVRPLGEGCGLQQLSVSKAEDEKGKYVRGMLERGEAAMRTVLSGVDVSGEHFEVVGRIVRRARELGARGFMSEAEVYLGRGRGKSRMDLTFSWSGLKYGIEVDWRRP